MKGYIPPRKPPHLPRRYRPQYDQAPRYWAGILYALLLFGAALLWRWLHG